MEIGTSPPSLTIGLSSILVLFVLFLSGGLVSDACAWSFMAVTRQTKSFETLRGKHEKMVSHNVLVNNKR